VEVDQPGCDDQPGGVTDFAGLSINRAVEGRHLPAGERHVHDRVDALPGIDHPSPLIRRSNDKIRRLLACL
jgi:hypothetical protein